MSATIVDLPSAQAIETTPRDVEKRVIFASSLGTMFEWYDFFLAGALAAEISKNIFSGVNPAAAFIFTLLSFAAGFAVRPFGALVFGRIGDTVGRKYTFLLTLGLMGLATFVIGLLRYFSSACECCRVWPWAGNMAAPLFMWPNMPPIPGVEKRQRGSKPPPRWDCYCHWPSFFPPGLFSVRRNSRVGAGEFLSWSRSCCCSFRFGFG